jgi:mevalonate kinase
VIANTQHKTTTYRAAGKLMLFGEYLVLKGAKSLAFPLKYGQTLEVSPSENMIHWESWSPEGCWFKSYI